MEESSGVKRLEKDEISLLEEELVQLTVKSLMVVPSEHLTLLCLIWTKKSYNPDSFRAQMKIIWKTRKNFEIQVAGQNLFLIVFETEEDLETKPLRRGIFVSIGNQWKSWIFFKYENLANFSFGCGRMGDRVKECIELKLEENDKLGEDLPYSLCSYTGNMEMFSGTNKKPEGEGAIIQGTFALSKSRNEDWMLDGHDEANVHKEQSIVEKVEGLNGSNSMLEGKSKLTKKASWKRIAPGVMMNGSRDERVVGKRKLAKIGIDERRTTNSCEDGFKRTKLESMDLHAVAHSNLMMENSE
ncbi:hypothetical protein Goklo_005068 [Gossypium klotzschianum]|uniref:Zinc knuckle CX2CX4HX4C domain-containing protein n=1 Tax=Gossypium klotzschianum TaxID=34286 RepID=A0A7J8VQV4_9ROSI|nr:hypothetical protein [Gossypium klotzschianum]